MNNGNKARKIRNRYRPKLNRARWDSLLGKTPDAPLVYIQLIAEYFQALKDIGYRITDETESGRSGRLVLITDEWKAAQSIKMTEVDRLLCEARKLEPKEGASLIRQAIQKMAESNVP